MATTSQEEMMFFKFLVLVLWIQLAWMSTQGLEQSPPFQSIQEGEDFTVYCNSSSVFTRFQWYRQEPGKGLVLLMTLVKSGEVNKQKRLTARFGEARKDSSLHIATTQLGDAGVYLCSGRAGGAGYGQIFGQGTILTVHPNIKNPDPSVYQLRKHKVNNASVCLFTDFDSQVNVSQSTDNEAFKSGTTVLDMRSTHSKSNGALAWSTDANFECKDAFDEQDFFPNSGIPCDAKSEEKSFETDMNLNLQNLSVIGLRILFLKVAGFNLLMTLRLWSS